MKKHGVVAIFSSHYFPSYVGGGERLAELTAEGMRRIGIEPVILTASHDGERRQRCWNEVDVIEIPIRNNDRLSDDVHKILRSRNAEALHIVGTKDAADVAEAGRGAGLPTGLAATDYSLECNNATLVRRAGAFCDGPESPTDCFRCRLEGTRSRDRALGIFGRSMGRAAPWIRSTLLESVLGPGRAPQLDWWTENLRRDRERTRLLGAIDVLFHATEFAQARHRQLTRNLVRDAVCGHPIETLPSAVRRIRSSELRVGFIGRSIPFKGLHFLIDAIGLARSKCNIHLEIYSPENPDWSDYRFELQKVAQSHAEYITWSKCANLSGAELDAIHSNLDLLAVPSTWPEYVGFVTLEALARGTPVLLSDFPPQRELFAKIDGVYFARPADVEAIAAILVQLYTRAERYPIIDGILPSIEDYANTVVSEYDQI